MLRYNTSTNSLEVYGSASWEPAGSLRWEIVTTNDDIEKGEAFMVDTTSIAITITLPLTPIIGDTVRIMDVAGNASTNNITINRNGKPIMGSASNLTISTDNASIGLVYSDTTFGWRLIEVL
jgi:hypothetical protein